MAGGSPLQDSEELSSEDLTQRELSSKYPSMYLRRPKGSGAGKKKLRSPPDRGALEKRPFWGPCTGRLLLLLGLVIVGFWMFVLPWPPWEDKAKSAARDSPANCSLVLAESIPEGMSFGPGGPQHLSTHQAWLQLIHRAQSRVDIVAYNFPGPKPLPTPNRRR
ncbi:phospholipase D3-like [Sarcophilus harrisii]|uniref:phospholipase D3-like n=1 Tax=Sarcophilus harrisii TaxID=9305 RepID=UPI001301EE3A|nr:phospholipase D3-like [Sarcophilus harrisii]